MWMALALQDCNSALRLRPQFVEALDSRGLVNLKFGLDRNAIADYELALRINPQLASALYGRGVAKKRIGDVVAGDRDIAAANAMHPGIAGEFKSYGVELLPDKSSTLRSAAAVPAKIGLPEPIVGLWCEYGRGKDGVSYLRNDASAAQPDTPCTKEGGTEWILVSADGSYSGREWQCGAVALTAIDRGQVIKGQPGANAVYGVDARCARAGDTWKERARIEVERWGSALTLIRSKR
jgi:hypothetical protein